LVVIALVALAVVVLNLQTSLDTAAALVRVAFFIAIALALYMLWRDFGRGEIDLWPTRPQRVFYAAIALALVDLGWYFAASPSGSSLLAFLLVAAACIYAAVRTWRDQHRYG
jgi:hypothetical protein